MSKKYICFTHSDLDGCVSYMLLKWAFPKLDIPYVKTTARYFRSEFTGWLVNNNLEDYDKVFIFDLDIAEHKDLIDKPNVVIIDHHKSHEVAKYEKATAVVKEYTSAAKLVYKAFTKLYKLELTDAQKKLILLTDDFDSYTLQLKDSIKLNMVFWGTNKSFDSFMVNFNAGFNGFSLEQQNIIKFSYKEIEQIKETMPVYYGKIDIQGKPREVYASFAETHINDVADILFDTYKADIAIVVNNKLNHVSFRRAPKLEDISLIKLTQTLVDGGGHEYASGGEITDKFINFTKLLKQVK